MTTTSLVPAKEAGMESVRTVVVGVAAMVLVVATAAVVWLAAVADDGTGWQAGVTFGGLSLRAHLARDGIGVEWTP